MSEKIWGIILFSVGTTLLLGSMYSVWTTGKELKQKRRSELAQACALGGGAIVMDLDGNPMYCVIYK